jgi:hypothetical protein
VIEVQYISLLYIVVECEAGFYCLDSTSKLPCPAGHTCLKASKNGKPCEVGTFNPNLGSIEVASCKSCPDKMTTLRDGSVSHDACICKAGLYMRSNESLACVPCPEGLICNAPGLHSSTVTVADGYYPMKLVNDVGVIICPGFHRACMNGTCAKGYRGFLCSSCLANYYAVTSIEGLQCHSCQSDSLYTYFQIIILFLVSCVFLAILIRVKIRKGNALLTRVRSGLNANSVGDEGISMGLLQRLCLNHLQVLGLLGRFVHIDVYIYMCVYCILLISIFFLLITFKYLFRLNIKWPISVANLFRWSSNISSLSLLGSDFDFGGGLKCVLYSPNVPSTVNEIILYSVGLFVGSILIIAFFWLRSSSKKKKANNNNLTIINVTANVPNNISSNTVEISTTQQIAIGLIGLYYVGYSTMVRIWFEMFSCESNVYETFSRLRGDLDVICYGSIHYEWIFLVALPVFLLVILGFPALAFVKLYRMSRSGRLQSDANVMATYRF